MMKKIHVRVEEADSGERWIPTRSKSLRMLTDSDESCYEEREISERPYLLVVQGV